MLEAIRHIPGARLAASRDAKNPHRLAEKIERQGQPAETVSDYGAAQIAVDSPQAKDAVVAAVKQHFTVLRQQDHFAFGDPEYHYRSYSLQLQMPNGASEELQIVPRPVFEANREEHHDYKQVRNAELAGRSAEPARAAARAINDRAMERFNSRNGVAAEVKGAVVKGFTGKAGRRRGGAGRLRGSEHADRAGAHRRRTEHYRAAQRSARVFLMQGLYPTLGGGPPRRVSSPRLRPGSTLGLGLGAFFVSCLPLSLLPMKPNITRMAAKWRCTVLQKIKS